MVINGKVSRNGPGTGRVMSQSMAAQADDFLAQLVALGDLQVLALIVAGAFASAIVNGMTGFGTALTGLPFWLQAVEPLLAAQLASACSVIGHLTTFRDIRRTVDWRRLWPMLVFGLIGIPFGTWLLPRISLTYFKLAFGALLIAYCAFRLFAAHRARLAVRRPGAERSMEAVLGFAGGVLGGFAGLSGVLPTVWASLKGWTKDEQRAVFQAFNFTLLAAMLAVSWTQGLVQPRFYIAALLAAPATVVGARLGMRLYKRFDDVRFQRLVLFALLISGLCLVWSSFWGDAILRTHASAISAAGFQGGGEELC
jgi:uncharacterized protein